MPTCVQVGEPVTDSTAETSHFGYFGQWLSPYARTAYDPKVAAQEGSSYRGSKATDSIEGGLFSASKLGKTKYPKYLPSASTKAYTPWSDTSRGWGFSENALDCSYLGVVYLSNRIIIPPSGISYEPSQETHATDGGIFVGAAWLAFPIFHAKYERNNETVRRTSTDPMLSWTHVIDTAQLRGPVLTYAPEFFTRRYAAWCQYQTGQDGGHDWSLDPSTMSGHCLDPSLYQTLGYSPADGLPTTGGEFEAIPAVFHDSTATTENLGEWTGPTFWKLPQFGFPSAQTKEPYVLDMRTYDVTVFDNMVDMWAVSAIRCHRPAIALPCPSPYAHTLGSPRLAYPSLKPFSRASSSQPGSCHDEDAGEDDDEPLAYSHDCINRTEAAVEGFFKNSHSFSPGSYSMKAVPPTTNVDGVEFHVRYKDATSQVETDLSLLAPITVSHEEYEEPSTLPHAHALGGSGSNVDPKETNLYYDWTSASREWSRYAKTVRHSDGTLKLALIDEQEAPEALKPLEYTEGLKGRAQYASHEALAQTDSTFDATCWECTDSSRCELQVRTITTESGAVVSYRWFRWRDQPSLVSLAKEFPQQYTDSYLAHMQKRVEWMHTHWGSSAHPENFLKRPKKLKHLAELEHALVLDAPPDGVPSYGWVPVSLSEEYPATAACRQNGGATAGSKLETAW